ncbi:Thymidylate kinase [Alphaproteobacteria bacterium SO-S41]|nr:Thymidylate kinase [Alphaproteobacteria bacterium SO-S41]
MSTPRLPGFFLTLEGGEGAGKSTQGRRLAATLRERGFSVVLTREPGGAPGAEDIRKLLVTGDAARWTPLTEALLMFAARDDHLARTIRPALESGAIVISDRFADSSEAYQGAGGGVPADTIASLRRLVVGDTEPDLTLIFDLPCEVGLARAHERGGDARFESKGRDYHQRLRDAFLAIAQREPKRCTLIDANQTEDDVAQAILNRTLDALGKKGLLP